MRSGKVCCVLFLEPCGPFLRFLAGDLRGKRVIEVGPGPGGITRAALQAGASEVHVVELDTRFLPSLKLLQESVGPDRLHINVGNCLHFNVQSKLTL